MSPYKDSRATKLSGVNEEIIELLVKNPKMVFLTRQIQIQISIKISHSTLGSYLNELAEEGKINKIQSDNRELWQKK